MSKDNSIEGGFQIFCILFGTLKRNPLSSDNLIPDTHQHKT